MMRGLGTPMIDYIALMAEVQGHILRVVGRPMSLSRRFVNSTKLLSVLAAKEVGLSS